MSKLFTRSEYFALAAVTSDFFLCLPPAVTDSCQGLAALREPGQAGVNLFQPTCSCPLRPVQILQPYVTGNGFVFDLLDGFCLSDCGALDAPDFIASGSVRLSSLHSEVAFCQTVCRT